MIFLIIIWSLLMMIFFVIGSVFLDLTKSSCFRRIGDQFIISVWLGVIIVSNVILGISIFTRLSLLVFSAVCIGVVLFSLLVLDSALDMRHYREPSLSDQQIRLGCIHYSGDDHG